MDNYIIKGCGTIDEIITALKSLDMTFGKDATLEEVAVATRYGHIKTAVRKQFEGSK